MLQLKRLTYGIGLQGPQAADMFQQRTLHGIQRAQLACVSLDPEGQFNTYTSMKFKIMAISAYYSHDVCIL